MTAYVYRCFDADGRLIYVGSTSQMSIRLRSHRTQSWWCYRVSRVKATVFPDIYAARAEERRAIRIERPRFNIKGRWATHATWTSEDYRDYLTALERSPFAYAHAAKRHRALVARDYRSRYPAEVAA